MEKMVLEEQRDRADPEEMEMNMETMALPEVAVLMVLQVL